MAAGDVYQEGLIFPPSRYNVNRDWNGGPFERLVRANVRVPEKTIGDCNAQFAANAVGARRVNELCEKFGADAVTEAMAGLLDYVEQRMRAAIAAAPDGALPRAKTSSTATGRTTSRSWSAHGWRSQATPSRSTTKAPATRCGRT